MGQQGNWRSVGQRHAVSKMGRCSWRHVYQLSRIAERGRAEMTITPEAVLQVAQIGVLMGIFLRMGKFGEAIDALKRRVSNLEEKV